MAKGAKGKPKKNSRSTLGAGLGVTNERLQHGEVELVTDRDEEGAVVVHSRTVDTLARFLRSGKITDSMYSAGRRFEELFARAALNSVRAANLSGAARSSNRGSIIESIEDARDRVKAELDSLGGAGSPCGSAAWFVLGMGVFIEGLADRPAWGGARALNPQAASGVLFGALGILEGFYRTGKRRPEIR